MTGSEGTPDKKWLKQLGMGNWRTRSFTGNMTAAFKNPKSWLVEETEGTQGSGEEWKV